MEYKVTGAGRKEIWYKLHKGRAIPVMVSFYFFLNRYRNAWLMNMLCDTTSQIMCPVIERAHTCIFGFTNRENNQFQKKLMRQNANI